MPITSMVTGTRWTSKAALLLPGRSFEPLNLNLG
jgi:hypothetical protein